ncbi:hypothetical protein [Cryptosporangium phraense]|uniref:Uncharacterized protein n=1 Tax=Cryptosporangium phraense TaxID=2593070 RepID=A0A545AP60_9ACTN|nr:hypothetical protein [Cryptosporangium phraense]TQS43070.1 hypothetical protein FL583_21800 [Cryptosporangium phraense]
MELDGRTAGLLRLSLELRSAAAEAGRADVVAGVDELMTLIGGDEVPTGGASSSPKRGAGVAETVQRILNGLGY